MEMVPGEFLRGQLGCAQLTRREAEYRRSSRASSPRRAIKQFLMPKQELQSPPTMSPSEKVQVDATSRRELFKVQASPAEVNQKLRAEKVAMPLGTATSIWIVGWRAWGAKTSSSRCSRWALFSSVTSYFLRPERLLPDPSDQKEKFICQVPEKSSVSDSRVRPLFERYWRYEPLFWPGF
jgi:hypothetical protein